MNTYLALTFALFACSAPALEIFDRCSPEETTFIERRAGAAKNGDVSAQYELGEFYLHKNAPEKALPYFEQSLHGRQAKGLPAGDTPQKIKRAKDMIAANLKKEELAKARGQKLPPKPEVPDVKAVEANANPFQ